MGVRLALRQVSRGHWGHKASGQALTSALLPSDTRLREWSGVSSPWARGESPSACSSQISPAQGTQDLHLTSWSGIMVLQKTSQRRILLIIRIEKLMTDRKASWCHPTLFFSPLYRIIFNTQSFAMNFLYTIWNWKTLHKRYNRKN